VIGLLVLGLGLAILAGLGVLALDVLVRRAELGAALLLASAVVRAIFVSRMPSVMLMGGTRVDVTDVVSTLVLGAAIARLLRTRRYSTEQRWLLLFGVLLVVSLAQGVAAFGIQTSVNEFRQYMFFAGGALYIATFPPSTRLYDRIGRTWLVMTIPMMILICLRWLAVFAGIDLGVPAEQAGNDAAIRVIDGPYAFFLAQSFVLTIPAWQARDNRLRWVRRLSVLLVLFVMVLDRRTIWLAVLAGVAVLMLRNRRLGRRAIWMVAGGAIITAGLFVALSGDGSGSEPVAQSASNTGNLTWRIAGWSELVASWSENPIHWFIGQPFGSGYARKVGQSEVLVAPHNFYLQTTLRTGAIGLLALIVLTAGLLRALWRTQARDTSLLGPEIFPALLTMQLIWFITWAPGVEQGMVTGLALALAARAKVHRPFRQSRPVTEPVSNKTGAVLPPWPELVPGRTR
jgi:hypothetical protein